MSQCRHCGTPLWQCRTCRAIGRPGQPDCKNPGCRRGSMLPEASVCSQTGGDSGRTGAYHLPGASDQPFLQGKIPYTRLVVPGEIQGVAAGTGRLWLLCDKPGRLLEIPLSDTFISTAQDEAVAVPPVLQTMRLAGVPQLGAHDPIAVFAERLHLLTAAGAVVRPGAASGQTLPGRFIAQCLHARGWLLVEESGDGAVIHRRDTDGVPLADPIPFPERRHHLGWTLPVADEAAAYLTDDTGQAWRFPWDGESHSRIGSPLGGDATLLLADGQLYVLPAGQAATGFAVDLVTMAVQPIAAPGRTPLGAAIAETADERQLWLGTGGATPLVCLDRLNPAQVPRPVPGTSGRPSQICTVRGPGGVSAVFATLKGSTNHAVRSWYCNRPYHGAGIFDAFLPGHLSAPRLAVAGRWLAVWASSATESVLALYYLWPHSGLQRGTPVA